MDVGRWTFSAFLFAVLLLLPTPSFAAEQRPPGVPAKYELLYKQDFSTPAPLQDFAMTDPKAWRHARTNDVSALELVQQSKYEPAVRSPVNIALLADQVFTDFVLDVDLIQTGKEYGHRDMCLFFGFRSPTNFYYAHIATAADDHAHNIFIVDGVPRTKIATKTTQGVNWGLGVWHKVRLERKVAEGVIKVYFDNLTTPIMEASDKRFGSGQIGFGSFDDTGMVDNIRVWAPSAERKSPGYFTRPGK